MVTLTGFYYIVKIMLQNNGKTFRSLICKHLIVKMKAHGHFKVMALLFPKMAFENGAVLSFERLNARKQGCKAFSRHFEELLCAVLRIKKKSQALELFHIDMNLFPSICD